MKQVTIYTDGACKGNPGYGGWGVLLIYGKHTKTLYGGASDTTNNRMELTAVIEALSALTQPCNVALHLDSMYVKNGITNWIKGWKQYNWTNSSGQVVKNIDLWSKLDKLVEMREEIGEELGEELELAIKYEVETEAYKKFVKLENQAHEILDWLAKNNG